MFNLHFRFFFKLHHSFFPQPSCITTAFPHIACVFQLLKPQKVRQVTVHCSVLMYEALLRYIMHLDGTLSMLHAPPLVEGCGPTHGRFGLVWRAQDAWGEALAQGTHPVHSKLSCTTWFVSTVLSSTIRSMHPTAQTFYLSSPSL